MFVKDKFDLRTVPGMPMIPIHCALCGNSECHGAGTLYQSHRFKGIFMHLACQYEAMEIICEEADIDYDNDHPLIRLLTSSGRVQAIAQWQWDHMEVKQMGFDADGNQMIALVHCPQSTIKEKSRDS